MPRPGPGLQSTVQYMLGLDDSPHRVHKGIEQYSASPGMGWMLMDLGRCMHMLRALCARSMCMHHYPDASSCAS